MVAEARPVKPVTTVGSGAAAQFKTVQAAVDAAPKQGSIIRIAPGRDVYKRQGLRWHLAVSWR